MAGLMQQLRENPPARIAGVEVSRIRDVKKGTLYDVASGSFVEDIELPSSNVLQFFLADETVVSARPSGTEPKIKFYASGTAPARGRLDAARREVGAKLEAIESEINGIIERAEQAAT
jgi:phosphoglucomutase